MKESKRLRRSPKLMNYSRASTRSERNKWCQEDLATFLAALETFGPYNIKAIRSRLPLKTELDVKHQIQLWKSYASRSMQRKMIPNKNKTGPSLYNNCVRLDEWIEHFEWLASTSSTKSFALAHVFALISEYGQFPSPDDCNGVDFRAMYRYLHCVLNGEPYTGVNPRTAHEINLNISHMQAMIKDYNCVTDLQPHLYNLTHPPRVHWKDYGRQSCRRQTLKPEVIMNLPHLNPLRIPPHMLVKPATPHCYSDEDSSN